MSTTPHSGTHQGSLINPNVASSPTRTGIHGKRSHRSLSPRAVSQTNTCNRAVEFIKFTAFQLLAYWHLLSFDAPTVASVWVVFTASSAGLTLRWTEPAAMFVAVWMLYAADRLLDARAVQTDGNQHRLEARHRFHDRHRKVFSVGIAVSSPILLWLLHDVPLSILRLDLVLGSLLAAWLLIVHFTPGPRRWHRFPADRFPVDRLPKEFAVGIFFPAAIFLPTVARLPALRPALVPLAILFAAVCSLNCLYIFAWEHPRSRRHAHSTTRWAVERLPRATAATILVALATSLLTLAVHGSSRTPATLALLGLACAASAALLLLVDSYRGSMSPLLLRASADLCLLTPALLLPAFRLLAR